MIKVKLPWEKLEKLKSPHKYGIFFGTIVILGAVFYFLLYQPLQTDIRTAQEDIEKLENQIFMHRKKTRELPKIKARLEDVRIQFKFAKQFLPEKQEIPRLLRNISDNGAKAGLNVLTFQPKPKDKLQDFYAEKSFDMKVEGPFLNVASFFYRIGQMERIVNIDNIKMGTPKFVEGDMILQTSCQGKTFRFLTPEEIKAQEEAKKAAKKKGKKKKK